MKIALVHNFYKVSGGEDTVFFNELDMLKANGHEVVLYTKNNEAVAGFLGKFLAFFSCVFSFRVYNEFDSFLKKERPDIVHVHNYFPLLSPGVFYCCAKNETPVVHTLHNYRAICPTSTLSYNGKIRTTSIDRSPFWTVLKKVYRRSFFGSLAVYLMVVFHRKFGTWNRVVDRFICLTEFSKKIYIKAGWPEHKLVIKPNFTPNKNTDNYSPVFNNEKVGAVYVGRLSDEKGIALLLAAWSEIKYPLSIVGDGPLESLVRNQKNSFIQYLGRKDGPAVMSLFRRSAFLIVPSTCFETFGMVVVEAASMETPAVVSKIGALQEVVIDKFTGLHFSSGDKEDLIKKISFMVSDKDFRKKCGLNSRSLYEEKFSQSVNYRLLIEIYTDAINAARDKSA